jgi:lipopolysaccharide transport protein LptA
MACLLPRGSGAAARAGAVLSAAAACGLASAAPIATPHAPISLDAADTKVDYRTKHILFRDLHITQGPIKVAADHGEATGLDFKSSRWILTGNVRIDAEQRGTLRSDEATVEFHDNQLARAIATGHPAQFEQIGAAGSPTGIPAHGHADSIDYEVAPGTVHLTQDAWLTDGRDEVSGPSITYNINRQAMEVQAGAAPSGKRQRVHMTILPNSGINKKANP